MNKSRGFSLVELSIVLVILGLLLGGILGGKALIRASELRSVTTQHSQYVSATVTFREKYLLFPGDLSNATTLWGAIAIPASCSGTASPDKRTCDGNGDGSIDDVFTDETFRVWQHLSNAGLNNGFYAGSPTSTLDANSELPVGKVGKGGWSLINLGVKLGLPGEFYDGEYYHTLIYASHKPSSCGACSTFSGVMLPEEAWNIDTKMDDGKPATGKVVGLATLDTCTTDTIGGVPTSSDMAAIYGFSIDGGRCGLAFRQQF